MAQAEGFISEFRSLLETNDRQLRSFFNRRRDRTDRYDELNVYLYEFRCSLVSMLIPLFKQISSWNSSSLEFLTSALQSAKESFEQVRMLFQMKTVLNSKIKTTIEGLESGEKKPFETHRAQVTKLADSLKRIDESISKKLCEEPSSSRREDTSIYNGLPTFELSTAAFRLNAGELFGNVITPITERARRDKSLLCSSLHSRDLSPIQRDPEYPKPAPVEILPPRNEVPRTKGNSRSLFEMFDECLNSIETRKKAEPISIPSSEPARRLLKNVMLTYQRKVNEIRRFYFKLWKHAKSNDMPNACPDDIDLLKESLTFELENPPPRTRSGSQDNHIPVESPAPVKNTQKKRPTSQNNRSGVSLQRTNKQKEIKVEKGAEVKKERDRSSNKENEGLKVRNLVPKQPPKRLEEDPPQSREKQGPSIVGKKISHVVSFK